MFYAITDTHTRIILPDVDWHQCKFIIHAGDFSIFGKGWQTDCETLNHIGIPVYFVLGNHEAGYIEPTEIESAYHNFKYIGNQIMNIGENFNLIGVDGDNMISPDYDEDLNEFETYKMLFQAYDKNAINIVVTHFQPGKLFSNDPSGSQVVQNIYDMIKPSITICGHTHKLFGKYDSESGLFNPGDKGMSFKYLDRKFVLAENFN